MVSRLRDILKTSIQYGCLMHCTFEYIGDFVVCNGPSMEPTLYSKNVLLTERITTKFHKPQRGDIIIAISPTNPNQHICKRIIGIPGDRIISKPASRFSSGKSEPKTIDIQNKVETPSNVSHTDDFVPRGFVWIEGDNSDNSWDSRCYGAIPLGLIKSRVVCRIWPLKDSKFL